jgi:hypothetical protein
MHHISEAVLGEDMIVNCSIRHQRADQRGQTLDFHFDASFLGSDHQSLNFWVSLDDAGDAAPSLTFLNDPTLGDRIWDKFRVQQARKSGETLDPNDLGKHLRR